VPLYHIRFTRIGNHLTILSRLISPILIEVFVLVALQLPEQTQRTVNSSCKTLAAASTASTCLCSSAYFFS
jgi:hypothetical protein